MLDEDPVWTVPGREFTRTFLLSDIVGSTSLWVAHRRAMRHAIARHDLLVQEAIEGHGGDIFSKGGDGYFAMFRHADAAVTCAVDLQTALVSEQWPGSAKLEVRLALHTGAVSLISGELKGDGPSVCAKVSERAHGRQILVTEHTKLLLEEHSVRDFDVREYGDIQAAEGGRPLKLFQVRTLDLPGSFPHPLSSGRVPTNIPRRRNASYGREKTALELRNLLVEERLVTLSGTGGTGKTRLAQDVGRAMRSTFVDGVWMVPLADLSDPSLVEGAVATVVGAVERPGSSLIEAIGRELDNKRVLIILDNCEHLVDAAARCAGSLLDECESLTLLATSRERLHIAGEHCLRVMPLPVPAPGDLIDSIVHDRYGDIAAVQLFIDRAREVVPGFEPENAERPGILRLCAAIDGLPLAIELAAAQIDTMSIDDMLFSINDRLDLLEGRRRDAPKRHLSMRATIEWSVATLDPELQRVFARLAVFRTFTLTAAMEVCADSTVTADSVARGVRVLHARSLLQPMSEVGTGGRRFQLLQTIRDFAAETLRQFGDEKAVAARHAGWCLDLVAGSGAPDSARSHKAWLDLVAVERENWSAALEWCQREPELQLGQELATSLWGYWVARGRVSEGIALLQAFESLALREGDSHSSRRLAHAIGALSYAAARLDEAASAFERAFRSASASGDTRAMGRLLNNLGNVHRDKGSLARATHLLQRSRELAKASADTATELVSMDSLGLCLAFSGRLSDASELLGECISKAEAHGDEERLANAHMNLAYVEFRQGLLDSAAHRIDKVIKAWANLDRARDQALAECIAGLVKRESGDLEGALAQLQRVRRVLADADDLRGTADASVDIGVVLVALGRAFDSVPHLEAGLRSARMSGYRVGEIAAILHLGRAFARMRRHEEAVSHLHSAAQLALETGQEWRVADALEELLLVLSRAVSSSTVADVATAARLMRDRTEVPCPPSRATAITDALLAHLGPSADSLTSTLQGARSKSDRRRLLDALFQDALKDLSVPQP